MRPLDERDLGDELRLDPDDVVLAHARKLRDLRERRVLALQRPQQLQQPLDLRVVEAGADVADVLESLVPVDREHERPEPAGAPALAARVAGDHELLLGVRLELEPIARALAREVAGFQALGHDPFELPLLGRRQQGRPVLERLGELHGAVALVQQLLEPRAPLRERQIDHRLAVHLEQVEEVVDDRRPGLALLHRREARAAFLVERADLAVHDAVRSLQRFRQLLGDVGEPLGVVLVLAGTQLRLAAGHARDDPIAVPLDLELPVLAARHALLVLERREHRRVFAA